MTHQHWLERWQNGRIGFHLPKVNPYLQRHWQTLQPKPTDTVFVPLCGKTLDLLWLAERSAQVIGIELIPQAVEDFFSEQNLKPSVHTIAGMSCYEANNIRIFAGDFFALDNKLLPAIDLVFDRAALIALDKTQRQAYVTKMHSLLPGAAKTLLVTLDYPQAERAGPPFAVSAEEVQSLYGNTQQVTLLESVDLAGKGEIISELSYSSENVYQLNPIA